MEIKDKLPLGRNKTKITTFIFDLDGVLVSTDDIHHESWKRTLKEDFDIYISDDVKQVAKGSTRIDSLANLLKEYKIVGISQDKLFNTLKHKNEIYNEIISNIDKNSILEGAEDVLNFLRQKSANLILASSSRNAVKVLDRLNLTRYFDNVVDVSKVENLKPSPEIFLMASMIAQETPAKCIVIEDSQIGIDGAKEANMFVIAYNRENQKLDNFDLEVKSHHELLEIIKEYYE